MKKVEFTEFIKEIKWMAVYAKKYWKSTAIYCALGVVSIVMSLIGSVLTKYLIDAVTGYDTGKLETVIACMVFAGMSSVLLNAVTSRVAVKITTKIYNDIQIDIYDSVMESDWQSLHEFRNGDLINRLSGDVKAVADTVFGWFSSVVTKGTQFLGTVIIITYYDSTMAIIALISTPISAAASRVLLKKLREYNEKLRKISSEVVTYQEESFQNIQTIKSFGIIGHFQNGMRNVQDKYLSQAVELNKVSVYTTSLLSVTGMIVSYACLGWSVYRLWHGDIIFGTFTLFMQLTSKLIVSFSSLISLVPQLISSTTAAGRIMILANIKKERSITPEKAELVRQNMSKGVDIRIDNMSFAYQGKEEIIKNADFVGNSGQVIAIVGASGEGKTTLIRLLLGLIGPKSGTVEVWDKCGNNCLVSAATRELFAYVPQGNTVFAESVADNLRMVKEDATDEEIIEALKIACAYEFVEKMTDGINTKIGEKGNGISEGQAQRIAIARAVIKNSPIILLDEATSALDSLTEEKVVKNIMKNNTSKLCIITTHRESLLEYCNKVYKIDKGFLSQCTDK